MIRVRAPLFSWAWRYAARQYLRESLWVFPILGGVTGAVLASVDNHIESRYQLPSGWLYTPDAAAGILTTIIAAMVGLFGFVVTISVLVVQMATGTLSPRFMRLWYRSRLQKLVLAMFVGTVGFSFRLLRDITATTVPSVGVTMAGVLFGVCLILLLLYLNRFAHSLRPVAVGAKVARQGLAEVRGMRDSMVAASRRFLPIPTHEPALPGEPTAVVAIHGGGGAVQAYNLKGLLDEAIRTDSLLALTCTVGDFVTMGTPVVKVYGGVAAPRPQALLSMVALGEERSIEYDPAFAMRIIVDIAIRALSPAVNDPTTGVQLINHAEFLMVGVLPVLSDARYVTMHDDTGRPRVILPLRTFEDYLQLAVTEIRQYGGASTQICRRLTVMLEDLSARCTPQSAAVVAVEKAKLDRTIATHFVDAADHALARGHDRQGLGAPSR